MKFKVILPVFAFIFSFVSLFNFQSLNFIIVTSLINTVVFFILGYMYDKKDELTTSWFLYIGIILATLNILFLGPVSKLITVQIFYLKLGTFYFSFHLLHLLVLVGVVILFLSLKNICRFAFRLSFVSILVVSVFYLSYLFEPTLACGGDVPVYWGAPTIEIVNGVATTVPAISYEEFQKDYKYINILSKKTYNLADMDEYRCNPFPWYIKQI